LRIYLLIILLILFSSPVQSTENAVHSDELAAEVTERLKILDDVAAEVPEIRKLAVQGDTLAQFR
tara:strand:+ start:1344 stop:1538 length:195 start_codon:yes stop_codon:yes gene_type:complete